MATFPQEAFEALWFYSLYTVMRLTLPHAFSHFSVAYILLMAFRICVQFNFTNDGKLFSKVIKQSQQMGKFHCFLSLLTL